MSPLETPVAWIVMGGSVVVTAALPFVIIAAERVQVRRRNRRHKEKGYVR